MTYRVNQIDLVLAMQRELLRQGVKAVSYRQMNAILAAATDVVEALATEDTKAAPGAGYAAWLESDDTGLSSRCMARALYRRPLDRTDTPWDGDDFGRCARLLSACPDLRFGGDWRNLAQVSRQWAKIVDAWPFLELLYHVGDYAGMWWALDRINNEAMP